MNTNSHNPTEHDLNLRLDREAERFFDRGGAALELGQVLDRAGEIRRGRRMRATMLMAACVLAIAVPTALVATRGHEDRITPAKPPAKVDTSPLTLKGMDGGALPRVGYAAEGSFRVGGKVIPLGVDPSAVAAVARFDGGLLVAVRDEGGGMTARFVDDTGSPSASSWPMEGDFAVADDGTVAAFVEPGGNPVAVRDGGTALQLARVPAGSGFDAVAVTGECGPEPDAAAPCAVWVQSNGRQPATWRATSDDARIARTEYRSVADVRRGDRATGITEVHDDLSTCSAVEAPGKDAPSWRTCGDRMVAFSPDGRKLLAQPDGDGLGPTALAVYDADRGTKLLDLDVADQGYVRQMIWEDDSHVLANVFQDGEWALVRIGLDGSRELAVPMTRSKDDTLSPYVLPSS
jgi:hypothetical protein